MIGVSTRSRTNLVAGVLTNVTTYSVTNTFYLYEARLDNLTPDTTYCYAVELGSATSPLSTFRTFGQRPDHVRFLVYGDSRSRPEVHAAVARRFRPYRPDFILHTGDLVGRGRDYEMWGREFFNPLAGIINRIPVLPAIGNHEEDGTNYLAYFHLPPPERWYSFDLGPVHVLALDFHYEKAGQEQFAFAERDLRASRAPWKVVFLHVPMFNVGGHASTWGHAAYLPLFHATGVDLVLAGHSHLYERFRPIEPCAPGSVGPILHITSGGGGANLYPAYDHPALASRVSTNHFVIFDATAGCLRGRACAVSGRVLDAFELRKVNGSYPAEWLARAYPEEWLRTEFEVAPLLRGRLTTLPSRQQPALALFALQPLTNAPGPVELELHLAPESLPNYTLAESPLRVAVPVAGQPKRFVAVPVRATGAKPITAKAGAALSPPLIFTARLRSGDLGGLARGTACVFSPPDP
jgi:predicted phosphodiesterase